jgi:transglutaminase-like putative cysteine protease
MMRWALLLCAAWLAAGAVASGQQAPRFDTLPPGWEVVKQFAVPADQTAAIAEQLGGRIQSLSNTILTAEGRQLRVNVLECATPKDAETIHQAVAKAHGGSRDSALRRGTRVIEFVCEDLRIIKQAHYFLGLRPKTVTYRVRFEAAPLEQADYMVWNRMFNAFLAWRRNPEAEEARQPIDSLSGKFRFGRRLSLRVYGQGRLPSQYAFDPKPVEEAKAAAGDTRQFIFDALPTRAGVPCVAVTATVTSEAFAFRPAKRQAGPDLLGPTAFWPVDNPEIVRLARTITAKHTTDGAKVEAILAWLMPGRNIRFGGPVTGSRYGVMTVLEQGFGQCWDFSDVCVTLCRAAGVPCRQVAGWLHEGCGHIWAEVLLEGKGWQQVDPTAGTACGSDYIPYLVSETGDMALVYLSMPEVNVVGDDFSAPPVTGRMRLSAGSGTGGRTSR